uniref:MX dynamin like GTPase 1 n=1 Tax=Hucho hucho TaxID=62062 RepID=A0A4W5K8N6_9TELE
MNNILNQHHEEKVLTCIDLDNLRYLGVENELALPAITVKGDQSSGKSSVLEALSGVTLPRGSSDVLHVIRIRKREGEKWHRKISDQDHEEEIEDPSDVPAAQDEMAGVGVGISDDLISLEIGSHDVPDLIVIDLPGIAPVAVKGQPENIGKQTPTTHYHKAETISLVVVPCNVDIATTEALKMAQEVDLEGERTLCMLTKSDLVDKGTEETVVDIVHNEVIPLAKGYIIVKCRGQKKIMERVSLTEATSTVCAKMCFSNPFCSPLYDEGHCDKCLFHSISLPKILYTCY